MKEQEIIVGRLITVTIPKFPNYIWEYEIVDTDVKDDSYGTIKLRMIAETSPQGYSGSFHNPTLNIKRVIQDNRFSVVEKDWFNTELTGRIITQTK